MFKILITLLVSTFVAAPTLACGPDTDCMIDDRTYRIRMPDGHDGQAKVGLASVTLPQAGLILEQPRDLGPATFADGFGPFALEIPRR